MSTYQTLKEFYPTPVDLIAKMVEGIDLRDVKSVLEPSAGKGDIVDFLNVAVSYISDDWRYRYIDDNLSFEEKMNYIIQNDVVTEIKKGETKYRYHFQKNIDCVEINTELAAILRDKEFSVYQQDFLQFDGEKHYDLIIMNPPFSNGAEHLLHAIQIAEKTGSMIVCLLNAETIRNPYSNQRKELMKQLDKYSASYEYISNAFTNAERATDVEIVIVKLTIPSPFKAGKSRIWEELESIEIKIDESGIPNELIAADDTLKMAVMLYQRELAAGKKLITEYLALKPYLSSKFDDSDTPDYMKGCTLYLCNEKNHDTLNWNDYVYAVRYKYWYQLLHNPNFIGNLTSNLKNEYYQSIREFAHKDFSLSNIYTVKMDILQRTALGIENKIISLFETLSYEHSMGCEKNVHYFNGWKSNSAFKINKKVVVPYMHCWDEIWKQFKYSYNLFGFLEDIEKCLDFLSLDKSFNADYDMMYWLRYYENIQQTKKLRLKYFDVDVYKKGTIHIKFRNEKLLKRFNLYGCLHKGWLPPSYGKKSYSNMTDEEKSVIDEYEGEEEYTKVYQNPDKYILTPEKSVMLLEG